MQISITKSQHLKAKPDPASLGFGKYFSDHMFLCEFDGKAWQNPRITPYENLALDPAASVIHYGQALFEGSKAFRQQNGTIVLFKPEYHAARMRQGAQRLCMQAPPAELIIEGMRSLVKVDESWVPSGKGRALYLRPTLIGTESFLGVKPSEKYLFFIILSPVGSYYKEGVNPVSIWVEEKYVRAAPGGLGETKAGANYAASLLAAETAKKQGYAQVLWLDVNHELVEEVGTMNVFFVLGDEIVTPSLEGTILAGGTRGCVLDILRAKGLKVSERKLPIAEVIEAHKGGRLQEAFGTGTAAVISPIGELSYRGQRLSINQGKTGPLAQALYDDITAIQYGESSDRWNWLQKI